MNKKFEKLGLYTAINPLSSQTARTGLGPSATCSASWNSQSTGKKCIMVIIIAIAIITMLIIITINDCLRRREGELWKFCALYNLSLQTSPDQHLLSSPSSTSSSSPSPLPSPAGWSSCDNINGDDEDGEEEKANDGALVRGVKTRHVWSVSSSKTAFLLWTRLNESDSQSLQYLPFTSPPHPPCSSAPPSPP